jgi:hypothetical protein
MSRSLVTGASAVPRVLGAPFRGLREAIDRQAVRD